MDSPAVANNKDHRQHQHDDTVSHVSALSDSASVQSNVSRISDILSQAKKILLGEPPEAVAEEEDVPSEAFLDAVLFTSVTDRDLTAMNGNNGNGNAVERIDKENAKDSRHSNVSVDFLLDPRSEMTWSRRIALALMDHYKWYNPRAGAVEQFTESQVEVPGQSIRSETAGDIDTTAATTAAAAPSRPMKPPTAASVEAYPFTHSRRENPSLAKAWAYFEHVALSRYVVEPKDMDPAAKKKNIVVRAARKLFCKGDKQMRRAEPGETHLPTKLYHPIFTPHKQLGDWGLGVGLYFSTLRAITVLTFLAGILNTPNFMYFSQDEYSANQPGIQTVLRGSAICTRTVWVPCPGCEEKDFENKRLANGTDSNGVVATFALHNDCDGPTIEQGMVNFATLIFVMLGTISLNVYLRRMEIAFDEDEQTAQDYSVVVNNPPGDATNPEEWRTFFREQFDGARVTACTIAVDNDLLVRSLVERREKLRQIEMLIEPGTSLDTLTLARIAAKQERERGLLGRVLSSFTAGGIPELFARLVVLTAKVQGLAQQDYPSTNIFLTFETEADQRRVLSALSVGSMEIARNKKTAVADPKYLFRGERLLSVSEPDEPNTVRWQDLNEKLKARLKQQALTTFATLCAIVLIAFIVRICNRVSYCTLLPARVIVVHGRKSDRRQLTHFAHT